MGVVSGGRSLVTIVGKEQRMLALDAVVRSLTVKW